MAHKSEDSQRLKTHSRHVSEIAQLRPVADKPSVVLLSLPCYRSDADAVNSGEAFKQIADFCGKLNEESTVCLLTSSTDAIRLLPYLEKPLRYQLWIAVKVPSDFFPAQEGQLPRRHVALLVMTRYRSSLRHTTTRIAYTYCPACRKTTKDYGGKKHTYNPYGTLVSDVWRDIECDPRHGSPEAVDRLCDLFGISPYEDLHVFDLRQCRELQPSPEPSVVKEEVLQLFRTRKPRPQDSRLINDDCLKALRDLPGASVDFCFADPPYNIQKKYDHWNDGLEMQHYFEWCDEWLSELARVLKPGRTLSVINIPLWTVRHYHCLCTKLAFQSWIAWDGLSLPVRMIMPSHYSILCFSKGTPRPLPGLDQTFLSGEGKTLLPLREFFCVRSKCVAQRKHLVGGDRGEFTDLWYDIHRLKHNSRRVDHPCQLPPLFMRRLIALFTKPDELVLDCFDGAGTTTLVAHQMGRRFIGMELSSQYHKLAEERHEMLSRGEDPFGKNTNVPNAKNSRVERLPKRKYAVSKKVLQLEVRQIARKLGRLPTREEVRAMSHYPMEYFENYFVSWGEVCAAARHEGMTDSPQNVSARELQPNLL